MTSKFNASSADKFDKMLRGVSISPEQQARITAKMKLFSNITFIISVIDDPESVAIAAKIRNALAAAGWRQQPWPGGTWPLVRGTPYVGFNHLEGIVVQSDVISDNKYRPAINALVQVLGSEGLIVKGQNDTVREITGVGAPEARKNLIQIGAKPK